MINFANRFAKLGEQFYAHVSPTPLKNPHLIHFNHQLADKLNLDDSSYDWVKILGGQQVFPEYTPLAALYAGHQFGVWVSQLGDGRAMLIAEHRDMHNNIWELQTKGGGPTPFSRNADGRAVLRSSIREYLCAHAMASLGVPTTNCLAMVGATSTVYREDIETAAVVLRVAPSFIRFGSFEVFASREQTDNLKQLCYYVIDNFYPQFKQGANPILSMYQETIKTTALMIAKWQALGFCHGVMNTDNMSILGLTLDYGPFGFMDRYDPKHICNHSDYSGRYAYANQPYIGWWNLARLGEALLSIISEDEVTKALALYSDYYTDYYLYEFGNKLGIYDLERRDLAFLDELLNILATNQVDWTIFWRQFSCGINIDSLVNDSKYIIWLDKYNLRCKNLDKDKSMHLMQSNNPAIILRNYLLQNAIVQAQNGDFSEVDNLFRAFTSPYEDRAEFSHYKDYPPIGSDISVSCSS
jgi:uncharacterized protein YdiU (UPF0061 family)